MIAGKRRDRRCAARERHVHAIHLGDCLEEIFRLDVGAGAKAGAAEIEVLVLRRLDEFLEVLRLVAGIDDERLRAGGRNGDGFQFVGVVALVLVDGVVERQRSRGDEHGVAVGRGLRHQLGRDIAAGAAAVLHHDLLVQTIAEILRHDARDAVGNAAGRERHQESDVLRRILLRRGGAARADQQRQRQAAHECRMRDIGNPPSIHEARMTPWTFGHSSVPRRFMSER